MSLDDDILRSRVEVDVTGLDKLDLVDDKFTELADAQIRAGLTRGSMAGG